LLYISGTTIFNNTTTCSSTLTVSNQLSSIKNIWHKSIDGIFRFYYETGGTSIFHSGNTGSEVYKFRNFAHVDVLTTTDAGNVSITGGMTTSSGYNYLSGVRINGVDTANTIYQPTGDLGITTNTANVNIGMNTYGYKINITPTTTTIHNYLIAPSATTLNSTLNVLGATILNSTFDVSGSLSVNANNIACVNITIAPATTGTSECVFIYMTNFVNMAGSRI
jgi:hypothetical protein